MPYPIIEIHLPTVTSTNSWVKQNYLAFDLKKITRVSADKQTQGRGQWKRRWISPKGVNLYFTYFFTMKKKSISPNHLSKIASLSIVKLLESLSLKAQIKWPNDILIQGKKIAGVLTEILDLTHFFGIVLGIGINVNMEEKVLDTIDQPATSLLNEQKKLFALPPLLQSMDHFFLKDLALYLKKGFSFFFPLYHALLTGKKKPITLFQNHTRLEGIFDSIEKDGTLNLLLNNGKIKKIVSAEFLTSSSP